MTTMTVRAEQRQQQTLSPRLQHAVRLLQLSSLDFAQEVHDALGKNPFLEGEDVDLDPASGAAAVPLAAGTVADATVADDADAAGAGNADLDNGSDGERDSWQADSYGSQRRGEDGEMSVMDTMAVETSLTAHLHGQLNVLSLSQREVVLAKVIVESLDDDGYLRADMAELLSIAELDPMPTEEEMQIAIGRVQALDPSGVGARSVGECLLLQLADIACPQARETARRIIAEHLPSLAAKDVNRLLECSSMLGICFLEKGMPKLAVKWFEKGLAAPDRSEEEYQGLRYDLATAYEAGGEVDRALQIFTDLYGQDSTFRDVATRVRELRAALR